MAGLTRPYRAGDNSKNIDQERFAAAATAGRGKKSQYG